MSKIKTPNYIVEFELYANKQQQKLLATKMRVAKQVYNACLGYTSKRLKAVLADKEYRTLVKTKTSKERNLRLREIERFYGYSEYQVHEFVAKIQKHFKKHIGSFEAQKLATRAFEAVEKLHYKTAKRVHFKRSFDNMTVENKSNTTGLRKKEQRIVWGTLSLDLKIKRNDWYAQESLLDRTKYVRIVEREIRGKVRYFAQLIQEGLPPRKPNHKPSTDQSKHVGLDLGTSTIAIVSDTVVKLRELAPNCAEDEKSLRVIQRAMDRSKRTTNPTNFNTNGTIKRGVRLTWSYSMRYERLRARRKDLYRKLAAKRKQAHETLANEILALGTSIRVEKMTIQGLQKRTKKTTINQQNGKINRKKRYGKTIHNRAPAMLIEIIDRKLHYQDLFIEKIDTTKVKASQFNHVTKMYAKKPLHARWNEDIGGERIQRDLYSAFLIQHTTNDLTAIDVERCQDTWEQFKTLHNEEIERLKTHANKIMRWYVA